MRLADLLFEAEGLWLLSYNLCPEVLELYQQPGIFIEQVERINNMAQRYESGAMYQEVLISNYNTTKRTPEQLYLFRPGNTTGKKVFMERLIIKILDEKGRVSIPKTIREQAGISLGDVLAIEADPPDCVILTRMNVTEPEKIEEPEPTGDIFTDAISQVELQPAVPAFDSAAG